ncbi:GGDEF domain-containing protein (plasmid) [Burkholderia sp. M6-3]
MVFVENGLFGAGRQTTIWIWLLWRGGYALSVIIAITVARAYGPHVIAAATRLRLGIAAIVGPVLLSVALTSAAITLHAGLPDLVSGVLPSRHLSASPIAIAIAVLCSGALVFHIVMRRLRTAVDLFIAVALLAGLMDVALTLAAGPRYSVGWYAARLASMCSAGALLGALLNETGRAYQALADAHCALREFSVRDALTGVFNRAYFDEQFRRELSVTSKTGSALSLLLIDVDHFKAYNDKHGHLAGDACLQTVASTLRTTLGSHPGFVARYGGEEFAAVLPDCESGRALHIAELLRKSVAESTAGLYEDDLGRGHVTVSIGHASSSCCRRLDASAVLAKADRALYRAKKLGRNRVEDVLPEEHFDSVGP